MHVDEVQIDGGGVQPKGSVKNGAKPQPSQSPPNLAPFGSVNKSASSLFNGGPGNLLAALELLVTMVLGILVIHQYFEAAVHHSVQAVWYNEPVAMLLLWLGYTVISAVLYAALLILLKREGVPDK